VPSSRRWTSWTRRSSTSEAIDVTTYGRQRDKRREELTLAKIDHHADAVDELDVEGILAFAERNLPRALDLWVQASFDYKQGLQQLFFPEGIRVRRKSIQSNRTAGKPSSLRQSLASFFAATPLRRTVSRGYGWQAASGERHSKDAVRSSRPVAGRRRRAHKSSVLLVATAQNLGTPSTSGHVPVC